jgi:YggT family protein
MQLFGQIFDWLFTIYFYILLGRFVLELIMGVNRSFRPRGVLLVLAEILMTVTDPPLKLVRRFIKPVRLGPVALDFSWTALLFIVVVAGNFISGLFY